MLATLIGSGLSYTTFALRAREAHADVAACIAAHSAGQSERSQGRLLSAKSNFVSCASPSCPGEIQGDCATFLAEAEADTPSVVFAAIDGQGRDTPLVTVTLDGSPVADRLTGRALSLDPGNHVVLCTWPDGFSVHQEIVITQGEKNRRLELRRPAMKQAQEQRPPPLGAVTPQDAPLAKAHRSPPVLTYVFAGVGVVALGSFTAFALSGKSAESEVDRCKPYCAQATADKMRRRYLIADISLGVGVLALGAGGYLYFAVVREPSGGRITSIRSGELGLRGTF